MKTSSIPIPSTLSILTQCSALWLLAGSAQAQATDMTQTLGGDAGGWRYFEINVPEGAASLDAVLAGGFGDADLYVRAGERPTDEAFDCRPYLYGNDESCNLPNPAPGVWHVGVQAYTAYSDAILRISIPAPATAAPAPTTTAPTAGEPGAATPATGTTNPTTPAAIEGGTTGAAWLQRHNSYRANHCAAPLTWDPALAADAQAWADRCVFEHAQGVAAGENLFASVGTPSADAAVDGWYSEVDEYDFAAPGFSMGTGHFTQVVWKGTTRLGCAVATCPGLFPGFGDATFTVCRYASAGNMAGAYTENVAPTDNVCQ